MGPRLGAVLECVWPGLAGAVLVGIALAGGSEAPALPVDGGAGVVGGASPQAGLPSACAEVAPVASSGVPVARVGPAVDGGAEAEFGERDQRPPGRESEAYFRAEFERLAAQGDGALRAAVEAALASDDILARKVAALQVTYAADHDGHLEPFETVLWDAQSSAVLREFAVRFLAGKARGDPAARAILARALDSPALDQGRRLQCMATVLRCGRGDEIERNARRLLNETDATAVVAAARSLAANEDTVARRWVEELRSGHPDPVMRSRLARALTEPDGEEPDGE